MWPLGRIAGIAMLRGGWWLCEIGWLRWRWLLWVCNLSLRVVACDIRIVGIVAGHVLHSLRESLLLYLTKKARKGRAITVVGPRNSRRKGHVILKSRESQFF